MAAVLCVFLFTLLIFPNGNAETLILLRMCVWYLLKMDNGKYVLDNLSFFEFEHEYFECVQQEHREKNKLCYNYTIFSMNDDDQRDGWYG